MLSWKLIAVAVVTSFTYRRLAGGIVHCAGSATYQIFFRLLIPNPNPNPIPNPKP